MLIDHPEADDGSTQERTGGSGDLAEDGLQVERRGDQLRQVVEGTGALDPRLDLRRM